MERTSTDSNAPATDAQASPPRVCVIVSRYNDSITGPMREAAQASYHARYADREGAFLGLVEAPGAFELTALATAAIESGMYDGIVTLGCVIRGETDHDRYISAAVASGLTTLTVQTGVPVAFGVITANTIEQARARSGGDKGNKGAEAMDALLDALDGIRHLYGAAADGVPAGYTINHTPTDKAAPTPAS